MPFFNSSSDLTLANSYLSEIGGDFLNFNLTTQEPADFVTQLLRKRREGDDCSDFELRKGRVCCSRDSDGLMIVKSHEVKLRTELISRNSYRMHSATHGSRGHVVVLKVFEGPHAKQDWMQNVAVLKTFLHSNIPNIVGVSAESSKVPFVVFHGISEKKIQSLIAKSLRADLNKSVELSMKAVKGLAAGLNYISSQKMVVGVRWWENLDIFAGDNDEPILTIHQPSNFCEDILAPRSKFVVQSNDSGIEALNELCQKLFSEVNSVLYNDSPSREQEIHATNFLPPVSIEDGESSSNVSENGVISTPSNSTQKAKLDRIPRREVRWRFDMGANDRSLDSIAQRFGDYLDCYLSPSSEPPLRRIRASENAYSRLQTSHRCPGYLREEITLTYDVFRSAIISYEYPSQGELCSICGQLVQYQSQAQGQLVLYQAILPPHLRPEASIATNDTPLLKFNAPESLVLHGLVLFLSGHLVQALQHITSALRLDPGYEPAQRLRRRVKQIERLKEDGNVAFKMGKWEEAISKYEECLNRIGEAEEGRDSQIRATLLSNRATTLLKLDRHEEALADADASLAISPTSFKALRSRARIYLHLEKYDASIADFKSAIQQAKTEGNSMENDVRALQDELKRVEAALRRGKTKDYYKILGVARDCREADIKRAYRRESLRHGW